jgi:hypothetical protein
MAKISITKEAVDPFFNNVSLLLPFDGSFNDASNNNFTVTANGNAQISSEQSKFGGGSLYLNGQDYLTIDPDLAFNLRNTDYTVECWVNMTSWYGQGDNPRLISFENAGGSYGILVDTSNPNLTFVYNHYGYNEGIVSSTATIGWNHIALVQQGSTTNLYLNGVNQGSIALPTMPNPNDGNVKITIGGSTINYIYQEFYGYIDDLRITKGVARYTSNFIPSQISNKNGKLNIQRGGIDPFFNNVSLLLPMDTSFADFSSNNFALTVNGGAEIRTDQTKFGGGAGYFGSSNDYLTASSSSLFGFGTGDFTIEMWIYPQGVNAFQGFFNVNDYTNGILIRWHASSQPDSLYINGTFYDWYPVVYAPVNTWSHVALVRYGGTVKMFVNGVNRIGSVTNNSDIGASAVPFIGASAHSPGEGFNGYIDDIRITKGVARYTADFTPPNSLFSDGSSGKININNLL